MSAVRRLSSLVALESPSPRVICGWTPRTFLAILREANDIRLVPRALPLARAAVTSPRLWVADRQFCNLELPDRFTEGDDHYLIRHSKGTNFHPDAERLAKRGTDIHGRIYIQEWGWLGAAEQGRRRRYVRRITPQRPGEEEVALVTDARRGLPLAPFGREARTNAREITVHGPRISVCCLPCLAL